MNTKTLARHYDKLTPQERLPLMLAAHDRGDRAEVERLASAAPRIAWNLPDSYGLWQGLRLLCLVHITGQLAATVRLVLALHPAARQQPAAGKQGEDRPGGNRDMLGRAAREITASADGWERFCAGMHIDPEALLRHCPAYGLVRGAEEVARILAEQTPPAAGENSPDAAEEVAAGLRRDLHELAAVWA
jgi:hypothetical protein